MKTGSASHNTAKVIDLFDNGKKETDVILTDVADEILILRAKNGDTEAVEVLIHRYQNKVYAICFQMCDGNEDNALDLTQDVFLKVFKNIKKFKGNASFYTWMYRIVINTCLDARRRNIRKRKLFFRKHQTEGDIPENENQFEMQPDTGHMANPADVLRKKELDLEVQSALKKLPEKQRLAFQLKIHHGLSIREIARIMGSAQGTVKSHLFRSVHFMRDALKDWN